MSQEEEISDSEKVRIVSDFILHAPPGTYVNSFVCIITEISYFKESLMKFSMMSEFFWKMTICWRKRLDQHSHNTIKIN